MTQPLSDNLRCSICLETFKEPKVLPCCHTFCKGCLSKLPVMKKTESELSVREQSLSSLEASIKNPTGDANQDVALNPEREPGSPAINNKNAVPINEPPTSEDYLTCPQCRAEHKLIKPNGVNGFLPDFVIENQLREQSTSTSSTSKLNSIQCDGCGENSEPVVACCSDCAEYLCDFCFTAHKKQLKKFAGHNVKELADLDKETIVLHKPQREYVCPRHPIETIQLYCQSCDTIVCNKCIVLCSHSGHNLSEIDSQVKEKVYKELFSLQETIDKDLELQLKNLEYVKKVEKVTNDMATAVPQEINSTFDSYIAALGKKRKELLADCESKCNKKMKLLWSEKDSLEKVVADMTTAQNFTKRLKACEDNKEFLLLASQALPRLKKLENWKWEDGVVEEIEQYSLDFHFQGSLADSVHNELGAGVSRLDEDQSLYRIDFQGFTNVVTLGKQHSFMIRVLKRKCCGPWVSINQPTVSLWHVENKSTNVADLRITNVERPDLFESMEDEKKWENSNCWTVTYTPYCGGRHKFTINVGYTSTHDKEVTVCGRPPIDSTVVAGPSYRNSPLVNDGTVMEYCDSSDEIKVQYRERVEYTYGRRRFRNRKFLGHFFWGHNGRYEIQLKHT